MMTIRNNLITLLLLSATVAVAGEYTDPQTNVVYSYEEGSGVAEVKAGVYLPENVEITSEGDIIIKNVSSRYPADIAILERFEVDGCNYIVTRIADYAFSYSNVESVRIPETVTSFGRSVFEGCPQLREVVLPESLEEIGVATFNSSTTLASITLPSRLSVIPRGTFAQCLGLCEVVLPEGLSEIGFAAFYGCPNLSKVELPDKVISIGNDAFGENSNLTTIVSHMEEPFEIHSFDDMTYEHATLYVPVGCKAKYEGTVGWSQFKNIVEGSPTVVHTPSGIQKGSSFVYDMQGHRLITLPRKGLYIQNGQKYVPKR